MLLKNYPPAQRISNDKTHGSFPFTQCQSSIIFAHDIEHILTKHAQKPPRSAADRNTIDYDTTDIPISFLKTIEACQQRPHIDYEHEENNTVQGSTGPLPAWSMDLPLTPGSLRIAVYGSTPEYQRWLKNEPGARLHNPPLLVDLEQGMALLFW